MRDFRKYEIWIEAMEVVNTVYTMVASFPSSEKYGLSSQITRSAVSIPSNIAEGASRISEKDFARFLEIGLGSCFELETQLRIAKRREYCSEKESIELLENIIGLQKRISTLIKKIRA